MRGKLVGERRADVISGPLIQEPSLGRGMQPVQLAGTMAKSDCGHWTGLHTNILQDCHRRLDL